MTWSLLDFLWPLCSVAAMVPVGLLLAHARGTLAFLEENGWNGERRLLARADVRRGVLYMLILVGNTAAGLGHALGVLPVYALTATYATAGSVLFGLEAWFEVIDLKRLRRERARRDRRAGDRPYRRRVKDPA